MKSLFTSILLIFSAITFAQIPSYVPSNGLVGWWPFNGNANDESGNGNNGTVNGATLAVDRFGIADKAYSFDGVDDFINLSNPLPDCAEFTISAFIFHTKGSNYSGILSDATTSSGNDLYYNLNDNSVGIKADKSGSTLFQCPLPEVGYNPAPLATNLMNGNSWKHLTIVINQSQVKLFINAQLVSTLNVGGSNIGFHAMNPVFGKITDGAYSIQFLSGSLDDIGIWNRALTECEIKDLYYAQLGYSTVDAGADQTICKGDLVTLQGAGGSSLAWDNGVIDGVPFEPAQSGAYVLTGADSLGCIGTDTVQVTVLENASSTINQTAIDSYTLNGQTYTQSGTYTQVVPAANGCDSVITLNLELDFTGIQSHTKTSLQLYPNPVKDIMTLVGLKGEAVSFAVYSVDGKLIKSGQTSGEIQLEDLKKGNYILKIENEALPFVKL
ncbi:MAG: hypothetical protein RIT34_1386 [Bacteroidota bacterium]|jgi:hypothetical protein